MHRKNKNKLDLTAFTKGILNGNRVILSKAITLIESNLGEDRILAGQLLKDLMAFTGKSIRIGISGAPGVGKSSFIEAFGTYLTSLNKKVAVLAIDPSSNKTGGSILGDKTRMERLTRNPKAFIRPTASGNALGGIHFKTREAMLLCEAAGFDVILIETVGVGQSEIAVSEITDFFLLLVLAGAGDDLQGIKRGIMEVAHAIAVTKADGENLNASLKAKNNYQNALHYFPPDPTGWQPKVLTCSAMENRGMKEIWDMIQNFIFQMEEKGFLEKKRQSQNINQLHAFLKELVLENFYNLEPIQKLLPQMEENVRNETLPPSLAAFHLLNLTK